MIKQTYKYSKAEPETDKYDDAEPDASGHYVKAVYTKAARPAYVGNPLIEALPDPLGDMQMKMLYNTPIPDYNRKEIEKRIRDKDAVYLYETIQSLKDLRLALPRAELLETSVNSLLRESYSERMQVIDKRTNVPVNITNQTENVHSQLVVDTFAGGPPSGIVLLGCAGCGKTNLVRTLMSHYPGVIVHSTEENPLFYQIPILQIECSPFANMTSLWEDFGTALDTRLNIINGYYHDQIARKRTLAEKLDLVMRYIKLFNIGLIFIDEIEHLNFKKASNDAFQEILQLQNKTNVGIGVIGNEEAYYMMFTSLRQQRRFNREISGSDYCSNEDFAFELIYKIMEYQWFEPAIDFSTAENTKEFLDVMYKNTKGIVDQIITLWRLVNFDWVYNWLKFGKKKKITPEYIDKVAKKYYPEATRNLLDNLDDIAAGDQRQRENKQAEAAMEKELASAKTAAGQQKVVDYYHSDTEKIIKQITKKAVTVIRILHKDMSPEMITSAIRKIYPKYTDTIDEDTYVVKALEYLEKQMAKAAGKRVRHPNDTSDVTAYMGGA